LSYSRLKIKEYLLDEILVFQITKNKNCSFSLFYGETIYDVSGNLSIHSAAVRLDASSD
jgi:hypothetical protein